LEAEGVGVREGVPLRVTVLEGDRLRDGEAPKEKDAVLERVWEAVRDAVTEGVGVGETVRDAVAEGVGEEVPEVVLDMVRDLDLVRDTVRDAVAEGVGDTEGVAEHQMPGKSVPATLALGPCPAQRGTTTTRPCPPGPPKSLLPTPLR
jgi:hypothetical protein